MVISVPSSYLIAMPTLPWPAKAQCRALRCDLPCNVSDANETSHCSEFVTA
jgi:hypothetical protein